MKVRNLLRNFAIRRKQVIGENPIFSFDFNVVPLAGESLNTFDELIEVFEHWDVQLRAADITHLFEGGGDPESEGETCLNVPQQDCEPGGLS